MKRLTSFAVVLAMIISMFAGISVTTNAATTSVTETIYLINQNYEDDCTSVDMKDPVYGNADIITEDGSKVMEITPGTAVSTVLSSSLTEIPTDKYTLTFDMRAVSPNAGFTIVVKNPYHEENAGFSNGYSLLIAPGTFVSTGTDGNLSVVDNEWYTYTMEVDVSKLNGTALSESWSVANKFISFKRKNRETGVVDSTFGFNTGSSSNFGTRFGLVTGYAPTDTPDGVSFVTVKGNTRWGKDQASLGIIDSDTYYPSTNYQIDNVSLTYEYTDNNTYAVAQTFDGSATDFLTPFHNAVKVVNEEGTSNNVLDLKDYANSGVIGTTSTAANIPSNQYTISFDMRAVSPNAGINLVVNNPYHAGLPGFDHGDGLTGYALTFAPGTFVSADENGYLNNVDDAWYTYTVTVDVDKLEGATLAGTTACGSKFITLSRKNRDTGVADTEFGFNGGSSSTYGVRFNPADSDNTSSSTPNGVTFFTQKSMTRWTKDLTGFSTSVGDSFADINYQLDNVKVFYEEAEEEDATGAAITNIVMQLGGSLAERNFTWFSTSSETGYITYATADELVDGKLPETATKVAATRDGSGVSLKAGYYNNKATITDLEAGTTYYYQLSNGTDVTEMFPFTVGEESSSFSFIYYGDTQIGANQLTVSEAGDAWERTLNQFATDPVFANAEFMMSAGDQINTNVSAPNYTDNELQYDAYINHPQVPSIAQASLLGNHDSWSRGSHYQHFNEPNYIIDEETGEYYGVTKTNNYINSADSWFTYNSVLFIALNIHDMTSSANAATEAGRAADKATFAKHLEFIDKVLELNKDNKDILWKVLVYHESPYGSSYHGNYTMDANGKYTARDEQYSFINMREYLLPGVYERDFDVILSGHDHCYTRTHILKHEAIDTEGMYYGNETITSFDDGSYTYADGTTTPTFTDFVDANNVVHSKVRTTSTPVKVTNPDGVLHITASTSSGSQCNGTEFFHPYAAVRIGHTTAIRRQAMMIDVTPTTLTFTNYGLGNSTADVDPASNVLDTFTIEKTGAVKVQGVSLPETAEVPVGQTEELTAKLSPTNPDNANVTWKSDNEAVAKVDENGVVTAKAAGTANITVTTEDGGYTATCKVTVIAATPVVSVSLDNATLPMLVGEVKTIYATVSPDNATTKDVIWTSSDDTVATVTVNGSITAVKAGTATITATTKDGAKTASCVVTVSAIPATSVFLDSNYLTMLPVEKATLTATVYPSNATYQNITWASSDSTVVSVDEAGNLKALKQGSATITATNADGKSGKCTVTVNGGWLFNQDYEDGENTIFTSTANGWSRVKNADGNWVMDLTIDENTTIAMDYYPASLDAANGTTPLPPGAFVISFDICNMSANGAAFLSIHAYDNNSVGNYYTFDARNLEIGEWYNVKIYQNGTAYMRKLGDTEYASVDVKKNAHGLSSGTNRLALLLDCDSRYLKPENLTSSEAVRATHVQFDNFRISSEVNATGIELDKTAVEINSNEKIALNTTFVPENTTDINVAYSTSNANVATVDKYGNVTGKGNGTATITVTTLDGGFTDTCEVTVGGATLASGVTVSKSETTLNVGETEAIIATVSPEDASVKTVNWNSENTTIATVDANGVITAVGPGTTNVVATAADGSGVSAKCAVTVNAIPVTSVTLDKNEINMEVMSEATVSATVLPENASFRTVTYTSSDTKVATVDANGLIKARSVGTTTITASVQDGVTATCTVNVYGTILMEQDFEDETNKLFYGNSVAGDSCWTRVQDEDGNYILKMNGATIKDSFVNGYWPTAQTPEFRIPTTDFAFSFDVCRTSDVGYKTLNLIFYTDESNVRGVKVDTTGFEKGVWYDIKVVYENSAFTTYYKKKTDALYSEQSFVNGLNPSSGRNSLHFSLFKDGNASTAAEIRQTEMLFDNFMMAVDDGIRLTKNGNVLKATAPAAIVGEKVYIAAYDAKNRLITAGLEDFDNHGTEVTLSGIENAAYFRAFIWNSDMTPVIESGRLEN